jgi:uncharacterized protein YeaO (DUF488 family)
MKMKTVIKRIYEPAAAADGTRVLVDRFWPRGLTKEAAKVDFWMKDIAPSTQLRKWFDHDPEKFERFGKQYTLELQQNDTAVKALKLLLKSGKVTLVYGAKHPDCNHALVLQQFIG